MLFIGLAHKTSLQGFSVLLFLWLTDSMETLYRPYTEQQATTCNPGS